MKEDGTVHFQKNSLSSNDNPAVFILFQYCSNPDIRHIKGRLTLGWILPGAYSKSGCKSQEQDYLPQLYHHHQLYHGRILTINKVN